MKDIKQKSNIIRVILDTNILISYLLSKKLIKLDELFQQNKVLLIFSQELLNEFLAVVQRPKFKKYFSLKDLKNLVEIFDDFGEIIVVSSTVKECRDEKDNFLLSLAKDGKADYLITGDDDLLIIKKFENTEILTYSEFILKL